MRTLAALLLFLTPSLLLAQLPPPLPLVTTSGTARVRVVPDLADLVFEVDIRGADLALARKQQAERSAKVLAALRTAGVEEKELQSSQVRISANFSTRSGESEKARFYIVSQTICCTLHAVAKIPDVTALTMAAGATGSRDAILRTSKLREHRDTARQQSIVAAQEKAVALSGALGAKIGKPHTITEGADWNFRDNNKFNNTSQDAGEAPEGGFAVGTIDVTANVSVSFLLE